MANEISRRGGASNLSVPAAAGLGRVAVATSKVGGAAVTVGAGVAGVAVWNSLGVPNGNVPDFVHHIPVVGGVINDALLGSGHLLSGIEHIPVAGPAVTLGLAGAAAVGAGYVGYKTIGKRLQKGAQGIVDRHHL